MSAKGKGRKVRVMYGIELMVLRKDSQKPAYIGGSRPNTENLEATS